MFMEIITREDERKILTKTELDEMLESRSEKKSNDIIKIENCRIEHIDLSGYKLRNLVLRNVTFKNVEFHCTLISSWNVEDVAFRECTACRTVIEKSSFTNCEFSRDNFVDSLIRDSEFYDCNIMSLNAPRVAFEEVSITNSTVSTANFLRSNFLNCSIKRTEFVSCCFLRVEFYNTNVEEISTSTNIGLSLACPEVGSFIGYKKILVYRNDKEIPTIERAIAKLLIPEDAKRSSATSNKCRCNKAKVLEFLDFDGNKFPANIGYSSYDPFFEYEVNRMVSVNDFNEDRWRECATGIHFFTSFRDAVKYRI